jgi:hypothetical protein
MVLMASSMSSSQGLCLAFSSAVADISIPLREEPRCDTFSSTQVCCRRAGSEAARLSACPAMANDGITQERVATPSVGDMGKEFAATFKAAVFALR